MISSHEQLEIGQVIYCVASDTGAIYPVQITEEVVHKSITGTKKSYTVRLDVFDEQGQVESSLITLDSLGDQWFPSLEMTREFLIKHYTDVVNELIARAEKLSTISFGGTTQSADEQPAQATVIPAVQTKKRKPTVTLLDGTVMDLTIDDNTTETQSNDSGKR